MYGSPDRTNLTYGSLVSLGLSIVLVALGHTFVLQRSLHGPTEYLTIGGDTAAYVAMIETGFASTRAPFKYRIAVPALGKLIPLPPTDALRSISYASLVLSYFLILRVSSRLGFSFWSSAAGLMIMFAAR